jgi:hypothetical protein
VPQWIVLCTRYNILTSWRKSLLPLSSYQIEVPLPRPVLYLYSNNVWQPSVRKRASAMCGAASQGKRETASPQAQLAVATHYCAPPDTIHHAHQPSALLCWRCESLPVIPTIDHHPIYPPSVLPQSIRPNFLIPPHIHPWRRESRCIGRATISLCTLLTAVPTKLCGYVPAARSGVVYSNGPG